LGQAGEEMVHAAVGGVDRRGGLVVP
jgi:hypothetical protein